MKKQFGSLATLCLLFVSSGFAGSGKAAAQDSAEVTPPPKILLVINEGLKPGQAGLPHQRTESAFVQAFTAAQWPQHYFAMDALSGKGRTLFFVAYDSLEAWQKDNEATQKNPTLSAALQSASTADGQLLDSYETNVFAYRDDLSLRGPVKIAEMRYMEISVVNIRPGHRHDWDEMAKMYASAYEKVAGAHWATFEKLYGTQDSGSRFIIVTPMKSLAEADQEMADDKQLDSRLGPDQMKKLGELSASATASVESHIFAINPKISYPPDSWVKADPQFWSQK